MSRKSVWLLHFIHLLLEPITGQTKSSSNQLTAFSQHPPPHDREAWRTYWDAQGQSWRTEPEIGSERREFLAKLRTITPDHRRGIYPFKAIKLSRADVEWLLARHQEEYGLLEHRIGESAKGLDLRGADLRSVDLNRLPLAQLRGGLNWDEWNSCSEEQRQAAAIHLEGADLNGADLQWASLRCAYLAGANLSYAHLQGATLLGAYFVGNSLDAPPADLRYALFDQETILKESTLGSTRYGSALLADLRWSGVNLSVVNWDQVKILGDEYKAEQRRQNGRKKDRAERFNEYEQAVRANRQLTAALQSQGLNEIALRFAYRAQVLQKQVFWWQMLQREGKLRQRLAACTAWLFSWFLFLLAGYGYRLWRSFFVYLLVIIGFTTVYYLLGAFFKLPLSPVNALGLSMTSFHGRGFFPGVTQLNDSLTLLASLEAFVGLVLEATFIATLTQRFFGK